MAIAVMYIGEERFRETSRKNHEEFFELLKSKVETNIYDFSKRPRLNVGEFEDRFRSNSSDTSCPYTTSGAIQVWDYVHALKKVNEDIVIKIRSDIWFTKNSMGVVLSELEEILNDSNDVSFIGLDFLNCCDKLYEKKDARETKKVPDFMIIAKKSSLDSAENILKKIENPGKQKSGNVMFKYILNEQTRAMQVSCQMYLLRKDYDAPANWQIYSDWTSQYHKSVQSQQWVANNRKLIGKF